MNKIILDLVKLAICTEHKEIIKEKVILRVPLEHEKYPSKKK